MKGHRVLGISQMEGIRGWGKSALMCLWVCPGDAGTDNPREPSECPSLFSSRLILFKKQQQWNSAEAFSSGLGAGTRPTQENGQTQHGSDELTSR